MKDRVKKSIILVSVGIIVNVILAIVKMYVGLSSNSLCIMLDAVNSFLDIITCIVTLIFFIVLLLHFTNQKGSFWLFFLSRFFHLTEEKKVST